MFITSLGVHSVSNLAAFAVVVFLFPYSSSGSGAVKVLGTVSAIVVWIVGYT